MTEHTTNESTSEIPYGYCHCGCGQKTKLATKTQSSHGHIKGKPVRFVLGHYRRKPTLRPKQKATVSDRFWSKVSVAGPDECWFWTASTYTSGYGQFWTGTHLTGAHRFAYTLTYGPIPDGLYVLHRCDNKLCCNPSHHFLGTQQDNMSDLHAKGKNNQPKGEKARSAKFTTEEIREIRALHATGQYSFSALARLRNVSKPTIRSIVLRINWKHV